MLEEIRDLVARVSRIPITDVDGNLLELGVRSMDMLRIVGSIETAMDVEFDETDLTRENFTSIRTICALVERVRRADGAPARRTNG
jgi:acyl carrier protein